MTIHEILRIIYIITFEPRFLNKAKIENKKCLSDKFKSVLIWISDFDCFYINIVIVRLL